jgi:mRNA interferase RelE/StbE
LEEFEVVFTKVAQKDIEKLESKTRLRVLQATKGLGTSPFPRGDAIKRLKGTKIPLYRLRIGDFRIVYHIDGKKIAIFLIADRKDLEKKLRSLL